jgi:tetratricopeptide (TPR) repeat protein
MLFVAQFPMFIIIFFGIFAYFLWKTFASPSPNGTREIFEFYLSANEILRDDDRRWFGFEVQEAIVRGERILQLMNGAPPLVYFTLGALYNKIGDHKSAINHLAYVLENDNAEEKTYLYASPELKNYVKILRKIEREPAEAPQTSAAVRALERARRNRGKAILEESRNVVKEQNRKKRETNAEQRKNKLSENGTAEKLLPTVTAAETTIHENGHRQSVVENSETAPSAETPKTNGNRKKEKSKQDISAQRQPITEVLRDIYDDK